MGLFDKIKNFFFGKEKVDTKEETTTSNNIVVERQNSSTLVNMVRPQEQRVITVSSTKNIPGANEENSSEKNYSNYDEGMYLEDLWNYIDPTKNTQAHHIISVVGFDEWVDMDEIRRRIKSMFFIEYKNEKSLYPYIKTLTDIGLLENTSVGGKRKWKKKELVIKLQPKIEQTIKLQNKIKG